MILLSELSRFELVDRQRRRAKITDLSAALLEGEYPQVTSLIFQDDKGQDRILQWAAVERISAPDRIIHVRNLDEAEEFGPDARRNEVLLQRDVQDALILDLENRRATRANDIALEEEEDGRLSLAAVDTSLRAIIRRISRGKFGKIPSEKLYDWKYTEFLRGDPHAVPSGGGRNLRITRLPPGEIAVLSDLLPYLHAAELLILLPDPLAADTLELMSPERQLQVFEELGEEQAIRLLNLMAPDLVTDLLGRLDPKVAKEFIEAMGERQRNMVVELLRYPEDSVGGIMTNDVVFIAAELTVRNARKKLRPHLKGPDFVNLIYVVDNDRARKLRGVLSLRQLFVAPEEKKLEEIMDAYVSTLRPLESASAAAYKLLRSHLTGMPVVDLEGKLLGVVTVDAAVATVAPASWTDVAPRVFS